MACSTTTTKQTVVLRSNELLKKMYSKGLITAFAAHLIGSIDNKCAFIRPKCSQGIK